MKMMKTKTLQEWAAEFNLLIIDPDGYDRSDPNLLTKQFTKEEFMTGIFKCTVTSLEDTSFKTY